nr:hypothetical protein [Tanacetum cinerariifolium]
MIIPGHAGIIQPTNLNNKNDQWTVMSTKEYKKKVVEDVGKDEDFKSEVWVSATDYVNANGGTSCSSNMIGDLTVTMKDLSGTISRIIHHKFIGDGGYKKDITEFILANVLVFTPKPSMHYLNITKRNVVKVFRKDTELKVAMVNALP